MNPPTRTNAPGRTVVFYDGDCKFCTAGARKLQWWAASDSVEMIDFHQPGALEPFPGLTQEMCMQQMYLVRPNGRVYVGAEAIVQALKTRRVIGWLANIYYCPGLRWVIDLCYRLIAKHRYRIMGKREASSCEDGGCTIHFSSRKNEKKRINSYCNRD